MKINKDIITWYKSAVKSTIILNCGVSESVAQEAIQKYKLDDRIKMFPEIQLHIDPNSVINEMMAKGIL